jgi:hypothetical protein
VLDGVLRASPGSRVLDADAGVNEPTARLAAVGREGLR